MLERILPYERDLFFLINGTHSYLTDCIMWLFSGSIIWLPIIVLFLFTLVYKKRWTEWLPLFISIAILFLLCDQVSSGLIKPAFMRLRPTHYPGIMEHVRTLYGYSGGKYGFVSGHACNAFGFSVFTILLFRNKIYTITIVLWAFLIAYSRVYLGVHFISDISAGAVIGIVIGFGVFRFYTYISQQVGKRVGVAMVAKYSNKQTSIMSAIITSYIILFSVSSELLINIISHIKIW